MRDAVVVDTSCLIALASLDLLELLEHFYGIVTIPHAVRDEFGAELPSWVAAEPAGNAALVGALSESLGNGEAEAIALAAENPRSLLILDDLRARRIARSLGIAITGTLGVLIRARREGRIPSLRRTVEELEASGFRLSEELRAAALKMARES